MRGLYLERYLNINLSSPTSTLTKIKRGRKHKNIEHLFEVGTSCLILFTYCVPSSEDGCVQFLRFVFNFSFRCLKYMLLEGYLKDKNIKSSIIYEVSQDGKI